jgi:hypothetical protein
MADTGKRRISAKQIVADIRSGMDDAWLRRQYGLSEKALESIYGKLIDAGALSQSELRNRPAPATERSRSSMKKNRDEEPRCPSCSASMTSGLGECPVCGIVLSKFVPGRAEGGSVSVEQVEDSLADSRRPNRWVSIGVSIVVLAVLGVALVIWAAHREKQKWRIVTGDPVQVIKENDSPTDISDEVADEDQPVAINKNNGALTRKSGETWVAEREPEAPEEIREGPEQQIARSPQPIQTLPIPPADNSEYVTGELRRFTSGDFKKQVVEASRTYPVIFQFYSDT